MNPIGVYETIDVGYAAKLRGTNQQTNTGVLYQPPTWSRTPGQGTATPAANATISSGTMRIGGFSLHNRSGGAISVGLGARLPNYLWKAGQWVDATTTFTDDTTDAQDSDTNDFALETTTNNDGFIVLSRVPINAISLNVTTDSAGGAAVRAISYSSGVDGHTWSTPNANITLSSDGAAGDWATGEKVWAWMLPYDHTPTTADNGLGTGIPKGYYAVRLRATTAPSGTAGLALNMEVFRFLHFTEALADNGVYEAFYGASEARVPVEADALVAFFGTANAGNRATVFVRSAE